MADPAAEKRKQESEKKALDREKLSMAHAKEKLKLSQDFKKAKITLVARQKREKLSMKQSQEETLPYDPIKEASMKANKLQIMHSAKQIAKMKSGHEKENAITDLEKKAKKMGFDRADYEKIIDSQGAYEETMHKAQEEAEKMHSYMNTLALERSVNIWAEASKDNEDPEPIKGSKTLTKKTQEKVTINPIEKEPHPSNRHK